MSKDDLYIFLLSKFSDMIEFRRMNIEVKDM
jgi:hypothetical protein